MKAFVEFGHETSYTKSSSHVEFIFGVDIKSRENVQKRCLEVIPNKMPKVKNYFWLIYTLSIVIQKYKNRVTRLFFQIRSV